MSDRDESGATERPRTAGAQLPGGSRVVGRVAGSRRHNEPVEIAPLWLRAAAAWSWRLIVVVAAVSLVFFATTKVLLLFIAVFLSLVFTSVLRPVVNALNRFIPRGLATAASIILAFAVIAGMFTYIGFSVAGQWDKLVRQFSQGITTILTFLENSRLHLKITNASVQSWLDQAQQWVQNNSSAVASTALSSAGSVAEVFTTLALATFFTAFFLTRGAEMWAWFLNQLPERFRPSWYIGGGVAWYTFSGYTRGTFIVAASDAVLAAIGLLILGVPLAAPLAVLVFIGAFIPLIGAPLAMVIAMIVALAANGLVNALLVGVVIALIGQFEGHVLQPLVMGKQVSLHPVVVALSVTAGTLVAGILGAVVAVPLVAVAWTVFSRLRTVDPPTDMAALEELVGPTEHPAGEERDGEQA
ncbi:AI-2E family transporter [Isoptericola sp. b441]|uniref:AI-2E family transporter n=1 Tax=Actinotalea lenta TaxID=3064654 RepID=A0ABT9DEK6_9CELL|nr:MULTISPECIES: AI-2E family transporter [unclassified Isoptericola]MDO8107532.1 AI-2E family transporter [Isoptericola sp. b441]MDO8120808.1 AI-2E family transporter [Isoptericola sp. b490]